MEQRLEILMSAVRSTLANPAADPAMTAFVVGAGFCIALFLVVGLLMLFTPKRKRVVKVRRYVLEEAEEGVATDHAADAAAEFVEPQTSLDDEPRAAVDDGAELAAAEVEPPTRRGWGRALRETRGWRAGARVAAILFSVPVLITFALGSAYVITSTDDYCTQACHASSPSVQAASKLDHGRCIECHQSPGVSGAVGGVVDRGRMLVKAAQGVDPQTPSAVSSSACLRCHEKVLREPLVGARSVKVSHKEPVAAGMTCTSCHPESGHSKRRTQSMTPCLTCHGNSAAPKARQASAECETCHVDGVDRDFTPNSADSTATLGSGAVVYPVVAVGGSVPCGSCHDEKRECDSCHGTRLPHTEGFIDGGHARAGAFEGKQACFKCHTENECSSGCHIGFPGHLEGWKEAHKKAPRDSGCSCHSQRSGRTEPMCVICH